MGRVMLEIQQINNAILSHPKYPRRGWIGVDLDGTLARSEPHMGPHHIGDPVPQMIKRVRHWIKTGRTVKIFTARADDPHNEVDIHQWCVRHGLPKLEITNRKDHKMLALWDDRAVGVVMNIGVPILPVKRTLWQSLRMRLLIMLGRSPIMKVDHRHLKGQFYTAQESYNKILECGE